MTNEARDVGSALNDDEAKALRERRALDEKRLVGITMAAHLSVNLKMLKRLKNTTAMFVRGIPVNCEKQEFIHKRGVSQ